jgi:hypothetical protein
MATGDNFLKPRLHEMLRYSQEELQRIEQGARVFTRMDGPEVPNNMRDCPREKAIIMNFRGAPARGNC